MRAAVLLCLALLVGCRQPAATTPTPDTMRVRALRENVHFWDDSTPVLRFRPPLAYALFRLQVEMCSGKTREGWPTFWVAPIQPLNAMGWHAAYMPQSNAIVFGLGAESHEWVARHELLHFLLWPSVDHPPEYFDADTGKCGALVNPKPGTE